MAGEAIVIRPTEPSERRAVAGVISSALLNSPPDDARWEKVSKIDDPSRSFSAWEGSRCVGHASWFPLDTVVPGGARLPSGGVARVGVLPTHRRRGLASGLMQAILDDAVDQELALLSLRASEAPIYGRYGYGLAGDSVRVAIDPARARPLSAPPTGGTVRILEPDEIRPIVESVYDRALERRPGAITRPDLFWTRMYEDAVAGRNARFVAAHHPSGGGEPDGFVHYGVGWNDDLPHAGGSGVVAELFATDEAVELELWRYIFDVDLIRSWKADVRPVDDPVVEALADRRAYRVIERMDEQWLRLVDVDRALAGRTWNPVRADLAVTAAVADPMRPANDGCWRIAAEGAERLAGADPDRADLQADAAALGAAYLGGTTWWSLVAAGRVRELRAGAAAAADALFACRPVPFCGTFF